MAWELTPPPPRAAPALSRAADLYSYLRLHTVGEVDMKRTPQGFGAVAVGKGTLFVPAAHGWLPQFAVDPEGVALLPMEQATLSD